MKQYKKRSITQYPKNHQSYAKQQTHIRRSQSSLFDHQMLRIQVCQKQDKIRQIFKKNQKQLCDFFIREYAPMSHSKINLNKILHERTQQIRLIKNLNKIYFGGIDSQHRRNGDGIMIDQKGKIYQGKFYDSVKQGHGVQIYPNGNIYIGEFDNNKKHGKGHFYWFTLSPPIKNQAKFVQYYFGSWWGGLPDGKGSHQKNTGDVYDGNFKNGLKHGQGQQYFYNGDSYKGEYINGLPEGFGLYIWKDKSKYEGDFKQGLRNGYGVWFSGDMKQEYRGQYILDKKCGYGQYIWENKSYLYKGHFDNDLRHGYGELYYNGEIQFKGQWVYGKAQQNEKSVDLRSSKASHNSFRHKSYVKTPKSQKLPSLSRLRPPASAILKRINNNYNTSQSKKSLSKDKSPAFKFVNNRSRSPQYSNNSQGVQKISKTFTLNRSKKLNTPIETKFQQKTLKKRASSNHVKKYIHTQKSTFQKPQYQLLVKKCKRKNCGCNLSIPLHAKSLTKKKTKKKELTHLKTQDFCF